MLPSFQSDAVRMEDAMCDIVIFKFGPKAHKALKALKALIDSGVSVETRFGDENNTPLVFAAGHAKKEVVEYLLSKGARTDPVAKYGTALHYAALFDQRDNLKILVEHGADVKAMNSGGKTPAQTAHYPSAVIPLILGGAIFPYEFSQIDPEAYQVKDLKSAVVAAKLCSDKKLSETEASFKDSSDYMPAYESPQLEITDGDSSGSVYSHISQFHTGYNVGSFIVSPAINYLNDEVKGVNAEKPLFDYYADKINHNTIAKSVVFSSVFTALPNALSGANKILVAKVVSDACVSGIDFSSEYASSLVLHLASSIASFSTIVFVEQIEFYNNHPFITGVIAGTASEGVSLLYDAANMMQNYMLGEDSSLVSEAE